MKKISLLIVTIIILITLVSCSKGKEIKLSYEKDTIELTVGEKVSVKPVVELGNKVKEYKLEYSLSSNIATVDSEGMLEAKEAGSVTVTVEANDKNKSNATIKVTIKEKTYKITLDANDGNVEKNEITFTDANSVILPTPTKEGYTFVGWYIDEVLVTSLENKDYNLKAKWETSVVTITFDSNGGSKVESITLKPGESIVLPTPTKEGYEFEGWYLNEELYTETVMGNKDVTLVAKWKEIYKITYVAQGAQMPSNITKTFTDGTKVELPTPTKEGYNFIGWAENGVIVERLENRNYILTATWEEIDDGIYTISYMFTEGSWYIKTIASRDDVINELFNDLYSWAKTNGETASYEEYKESILSKLAAGEDIKLVSPTLLDLEDKKGGTEYFMNTSLYYNKWVDFFNKIRELVLKKVSSEDIYKDVTLFMNRMNDFITWTSRGQQYFRSYLSAIYGSIHIVADVAYEYSLGETVELIPLVHYLDLDFLGWYDNKELTGEPITTILSTDKGDKVFYPKWEEEIMPTEIILNKVIELERFETYQLTWSFNPIETTDQRVEFSSSDRGVALIDAKTGLITAVKDGITKIQMKIYADETYNIVFELEVYSPGQIHGTYETNSYVVKNEEIKLNAELIGRGTSTIVWESKDENIAEVDENGNVNGLSAGTVVIVAKDKEDESIYLEFLVTVVSQEVSKELELLLESHNSNIYTSYHLGIGAGTPTYYMDIYGSVSKLLANDPLEIDTTYKAIQDGVTTNHGGEMSSTEFITVHYTGNMSNGANGAANASYFAGGGGGTSIHYVTGNDGVYYCLDEKYIGYHAGDGSDPFNWYPTGVRTTSTTLKEQTPVWGISENSKFTIHGLETQISVPTGSTPQTTKVTDSKWINDMGLAWKVVDGQYYMGTTWWCYKQVSEGRICSHGGNNNSIGIESCVNKGSDLWYTWQKTAQLVANIMIRKNLDITRVVGHHFFSAKDCPQPMLENDLEIWYEFIALVEAEYKLATDFNGYTITAVANDTTYIKDNGRVKKQPDQTTCVTYTITISNGITTETVTLGSMLEGKFAK